MVETLHSLSILCIDRLSRADSSFSGLEWGHYEKSDLLVYEIHSWISRPEFSCDLKQTTTPKKTKNHCPSHLVLLENRPPL